MRSKEAPWYGAWGLGDAGHRKLAWFIRQRKDFQQNLLWKLAVGVWGKYPRSDVKHAGSLITCPTEQGKRTWMFIVGGVMGSAGGPPIFILPSFHANRTPRF